MKKKFFLNLLLISMSLSSCEIEIVFSSNNNSDSSSSNIKSSTSESSLESSNSQESSTESISSTVESSSKEESSSTSSSSSDKSSSKEESSSTSSSSSDESSSKEESSSSIESSSSSSVVIPEVNYINETSNVTAFVMPNTLQVKKDMAIPSSPDYVLTFNLAKGERETAQLILNNKTNSNLSFDLSFSDFTNGSKTISKKNIESYIQLYQNIDESWSEFDNSPSSWYPNGKKEQELGYFPDPIEPYSVSKYLGNNNISTQNGHNQGLFFAFESNSNQEAGKYEGYLEVKFSNNDLLRIKTVINIFDFTLPEQNYCKYLMDIATEEFEALYKNKWSDSKYMKDAYAFVIDKKIGVIRAPYHAWSMDELNASLSYLKAACANKDVACYSLSMNYITVGEITYNYKLTESSKKSSGSITNVPMILLDDYTYTDTSQTILGLKSTFEKLVEESTNNLNLFEKLTLYCGQADEPSNDKGYIQNILVQNAVNLARDYCLEHCDFTNKEKVKESVENIRYITTCDLNDRMYLGYNLLEITSVSGTNSDKCGIENLVYDKVEGFCPLFNKFISSDKRYTRTMDAIKDPSKEIWWYGCCQPVTPYPNFAVNSPMITSRAKKSLEYQLGIKGELYFKVNACRDYRNSIWINLTEDEILQGKATWEGSHGDGLLIYPVYNRLQNYNNSNSNQVHFYSSLRLENLAEGADDYNYLHYATELMNKKGLTNQYQSKIDSLIATLGSDVASLTFDDELFESVRLELAHIIEELEKK